MLFTIAFRNIFRQRRRTVLTVLTMFGGFTLSAISIGWSDGTYSRLIDSFTRYQLGHIQVHRQGYLDRPSLYDTVDDYERLGARLRSDESVSHVAPRIFAAGLASAGDKTTGARITGIEPAAENDATRFDNKVAAGRSLSRQPAMETVLGKGLASRLSAAIGDSVVVVTQAADGSLANDLYTVVGLVDSGDPMTDNMTMYLHLADAQQLLVLDGRVHEIALIVESHRDVERIAARLEREIGNADLAVEPWPVFARAFYQAMKADVEGMWISLLIIMLVVAVGVLNTVLMNVLERTREYGLLRAVGTRPAQVFTLVVVEVFMMAVVAVLLGAGASWGINAWLADRGIPMPFTVTYGGIEFSRMFTEVNARGFLIPAITVFLSATVISVFPAVRAARTAPAASMRAH